MHVQNSVCVRFQKRTLTHQIGVMVFLFSNQYNHIYCTCQTKVFDIFAIHVKHRLKRVTRPLREIQVSYLFWLCILIRVVHTLYSLWSRVIICYVPIHTERIQGAYWLKKITIQNPKKSPSKTKLKISKIGISKTNL